MIYFVFTGIRIIHRVHVHKPIDVGTFGFFIKNRINDLMFNFFRVIGAGKIDQVGSIFGYGLIVA